MSNESGESSFKLSRQFKMKQGTDIMKLRINQEEEQQNYDSDGSDTGKRSSYCEGNSKGSTQGNSNASIFSKNKYQSQSLRGSFHQSSNQSDEKISVSSNKNLDLNNMNKDIQHLNTNTSINGDQQQRDKSNLREPNNFPQRKYASKSVYEESKLQQLGQNKSFYSEFKNNTDVNAVATQPNQKIGIVKQSSIKKLPQINKPNSVQDNIFGNTKKQLIANKIRLEGRNHSSTPKIYSLSNQSAQITQTQTPPLTKNLTILNTAATNILMPNCGSKDVSFQANSALFSSQKHQNRLNKSNILNSPLSPQTNISKLKMQFYQQMGGSPNSNEQQKVNTLGNQKSNYGHNQTGVQDHRFNINTNLRDMVDEKNLLYSLIGDTSPDYSKTSNNRNIFTYNSPLSKVGSNITFPGNNLFSSQLNPLPGQNNGSSLAFSQAFSSRIGQMNYLDESKDIQGQNFHSTYKNISKMQQQSDHYHQDMELQQTILVKAYQSNLLPRKFGLIKQNENDNQNTNNSQTTKDGKKYLNLVHLNIGSTYQHIVAAALVHVEFANLYSINIAHNNLTSVSVDVILQNLPESISRVDISNNRIGTNGASSICHAFNSKKYVHLRYLNISNNSLGDNGLKQICDAIQQNTSVYSLDISYNKLSDQACVYIQQILINNSYIQELYIQWNKFSSRGGLILASGLASNYNMRVMNVSHNGMGSLSKLQSGVKFIQSCSMVESGMRHLDLSYNQYVKSEAILIAEALSSNNKLFGFHFQGNQCHSVIDSRGNVYFQMENEIFNKNILDFHMNQRNIDNVSFIGHNKAQSFDCKAVDNCWLCDGWQEIKFEVKVGCSDSFTCEPAFLHLDFEDYSPVYMDKDCEEPNKFVLHRMCPPGRQISFFFTDPCKNILFTSKDYEKVNFFIPQDFNALFFKDDDELNVSDGQVKKKFTVKYLDGSVMTYPTPVYINVITTKAESSLILSQQDYESCIKCVPRQKETYYKINFSDQWHKGISFFRNYIEDSEELEDKCFEEDWNNSKIPFIVQSVRGSNLEECRKLLRIIYPQLRMCYKNLSVNGMSGDIFCISQNPYTIFVQQTDILDNNLIKVRDVDLNFFTSSSKAVKVKSYRAPDKTLIRNEFIEVIVRLAVDKFNKTKIYPTVQQALEALFLNDSFLDYIISFEHSQEWRNERYWNQQCDNVLKNYLELVKTLWNQFADSKKGEKRYYSSVKTMSVYEFKDFVLQFELVDDLYPEKEIYFTYNLSMMSQVDELNSDRYISMNFEEFLETLARIAEKKSMTPLGEIESEYGEEERKQLSLQYKLESFLHHLSQKYDRLFSKEKKKQNINLNLFQGSKTTKQKDNHKQSYINWASVMAERRQQLKENIKKVIRTDQIANTLDKNEFFSYEMQQENQQQNQLLQEPISNNSSVQISINSLLNKK